MTVHFYLRPKTKGDEASIQAVIRWDYKKLTRNVGETVLVKDWNEKQQRVRRTDLNSFYKNKRLEDFKGEINELYDPFKEMGIEPTLDEFRELLNPVKEAQQVEPDTKPVSFYDFIEIFINRHKVRLEAEGKKIDRNTIVNSFNQTATLLNGHYPNLEFDQINIEWYYKFVKLCNEELRFSPNNTGKHIKNLKAILRSAFEEGVSTNTVFKKKGFKVLSEKSYNIALSLEEIIRMEALDLSHLPQHDKARDLFVFGCYTGMRISDFKRVNRTHIMGNNEFIEIKAQKTEKEVEIPLFSPALKVLEKYNFELPTIPDQKLNKLIKEVGEFAGIDETLVVAKKKGTNIEEIRKPKFEFITSHTARRSFATNAYQMDIPVISIMAITGHSTEKVFLNYIKMTTREHSKIVRSKFEEKYKELTGAL